MSANKQLSIPESYSRQSTLPLNAQIEKCTADTESSPGRDGPAQSHKSLLPLLKRKVALDHRRPSSNRRPSIMDVNFNLGEAESSEDGLEDSRVKRSRRRKKSKREDAELKSKSVSSSALLDFSGDDLLKNRYLKQDSDFSDRSDQDQEADASDTATPDILSSGAVTPEPFVLDFKTQFRVDHNAQGMVESLDQELTSKLKELTSKVRETQLSSTEDELDSLDNQIIHRENETKERGDILEDARFAIDVNLTERLNDGDVAYPPETTGKLEEDELTSKLKELTSQISETQLSSTEDELDRFEDQIKFDGPNQPIRTMMLEPDDIKKGNQDGLIQYQEKAQSHVEKVEHAEEESSEKMPEDMLSEKDISQRNVVNETQTSKHISTRSKTQGLPMTDTQENRDWTEKTRRQRQVQTEGRSSAETTEMLNETEEHREDVFNELGLTRLLTENGEAEFDRIIDSVAKALDDMEEELEAYCGEGVFIEESDAEKQEVKDDEEKISDGVRHEIEDNKQSIAGGILKGGQRKETKENTTEEIEVTEDTERMTDVESSNERFLPKDAKSQDTSETEKREQHSTPFGQEEYLSPEEIRKKYSAASLRSITTEVLKVLNATEDLIHGSFGDSRSPTDHNDLTIVPPADAKRLDEQLSRLEENVYMAAGTVFGLEADLGDLEECARSIGRCTSEGELAHLEDQVASAAARVQHSELQVFDIASRIAALKHAGLNVTPQNQFSYVSTTATKTQTLGSSRKLRRRLPAPPSQDTEA